MKRSRRLNFLRVLLVCLCLLLPLSACSLQRFRAHNESQLVLATPTDPKTFNFANNQSFPNIFMFTYDGLTRENGVTGEIEPSLAESWQFSKDKKTAIFTLRPDLKWSDGNPLTADDVVFTYQDVVFNPKVPIEVKDNLKIGAKQAYPSLRKLDDRRVKFTFPEPFAPFLRATAAPNGVCILPKHALEQSLKTKDANGNLAFLSTWGSDTPPDQIIVNGPYKLDAYVAGQRVVFRRNPYYWRKAEDGTQLPKLDKIIWQVIENLDVQLLRFRSGDLDVLGDTRPMKSEYYGLLKQEAKRLNANVLDGGAWSGVLQFVFNVSTAKNAEGKPFVDPIKAKWFNTKEFRQAVAHAIDKERINTNLFRGLGVVQHSPVSIQSPYFLSPEQGLKVYDYNIDTAKQLLTGAGFKYDNQGQLFDADGNRVEFNLITNSNNLVRVAIGSQIKQDLDKIGMKVNFQTLNFNVLVDKLTTTRDWDIHIVGFGGGVDPHGVANLWMTSGGSHAFNLKQQPGQSEVKDYAPKPYESAIDRLFIAGAQEFDEAKRKEIYGQFQQIVAEEVPIIHLVNDRALMAVRKDVKGLKYSGLPTWGLWNIDELDR
ncbi:ABC transporter substrate-binding protein [filamentous cyanobacterium LEGE 11480]|uniref:ABC transporter substrate-binding protein n=1 Tax=Romeriopsis navalis LEGE 11480 TaxID=2777977 RepID=A0A928Z487_9CYAN|nr:ABC transporter substrate-binding protein [Romeriopsis navalis]MBE9030782.1 ABC transporter substrate-binding protein [Romeriopsis navalis LEGE 11480]